ncbi:MAG: carbamoyltransferase HypF [Gammaproteobacteria bacterium]|nr:carbamoyltransferase HypF [Gammaproteobacteria bacterium]
MNTADVAARIVLVGRVQGVGFRPFVYRLAREFGLRGWVENTLGRVELHAEGGEAALAGFRAALIERAPPAAMPEIASDIAIQPLGVEDFEIRASQPGAEAEIHIPPDQAMCADCAAELRDPADRRHGYAFINCTQCGSRWTIIRALPYDRAATSMAGFTLCPRCAAEYADPGDRRFHAEPDACPDCGPTLRCLEPDRGADSRGGAALAAAVAALRDGRIVAVKSVGGYHLMCDAADAHAVSRLRRLKHRPHKPLALLVGEAGDDGLDRVREIVEIGTDAVAEALRSPARPIVLCPKRPGAAVCDAVAPDLNELGVMLPPSPLHVLLTQAVDGPLVATSGNLSGEPVLTDDAEAARRLGGIADVWLTHDRPIVRPADDGVYRVIAGRPRCLRIGRGQAPVERNLPFRLERPVLAVGGHTKNTVALAWDDRVVISPHIGDLASVRGMHVFEQVAADLQRLYHVEAQAIVCDAHPRYASHVWAHARGLPVSEVQHHRAHASALHGEHGAVGNGLVFTWDGTGFGDDGTIWGGEALLGRPGDWRRVATCRPFRLFGGDRAALEPWRSAASLHWALGEAYPLDASRALAREAWARGINCHDTSAVGRLFDAVAAMLGLVESVSHEGEAAMRVEALAASVDHADTLALRERDGLWEIDWASLVPAMRDPARSAAWRAGHFHRLLANTIKELATRIRQDQGIDFVGLSGGVFQNRLLSGMVVDALALAGIPCLLHEHIPANDGGLSFGQVIEHAGRQLAFD